MKIGGKKMKYRTLIVGDLIKINENCSDRDVSENFIYKIIEFYNNGINIIDNAGDPHSLTLDEFEKVEKLQKGNCVRALFNGTTKKGKFYEIVDISKTGLFFKEDWVVWVSYFKDKEFDLGNLYESKIVDDNVKVGDLIKCVVSHKSLNIEEEKIYKVYEVSNSGSHIRISKENKIWVSRKRFVKATDDEVKEFINKHRAKEVVLAFSIISHIVEAMNEFMEEITKDLISEKEEDRTQEVNIKCIPNGSMYPEYEVTISENLVGKSKSIERLLRVALHDLKWGNKDD